MRKRLFFAWILGVGIGVLTVIFVLTFRSVDPPTQNFERSEPTVTRKVNGETSINVAKTAVVEEVVDGDTIIISGGEYLRLIGIDAPERGEPGFSESRSQLAVIAEGKEVVLESDVTDRDRYGRLLRYIWVGDRFINYEMVQSGYAYAYRYEPDTAYADLFAQAQLEARRQNLGLWSGQRETEYLGGEYVCSRNAYNCGDFTTHADSQAAYEACGGASNDIHRLDSDGDGIACESLR